MPSGEWQRSQYDYKKITPLGDRLQVVDGGAHSYILRTTDYRVPCLLFPSIAIGSLLLVDDQEHWWSILGVGYRFITPSPVCPCNVIYISQIQQQTVSRVYLKNTWVQREVWWDCHHQD